MMTRLPFWRAAGALAVALGLVGVAANPASAVVRDVDSVRINGAKADFGVGPFVDHHPSGPGTLTWDEATNAPGKRVTGTLKGTVWWDDSSSGGCARVRIRLYGTGAEILHTKWSDAACRVGGGAAKSAPVNIAVWHNRSHRAVITTQIAATENSDYHNQQSLERYWGQIDGVTD